MKKDQPSFPLRQAKESPRPWTKCMSTDATKNSTTESSENQGSWESREYETSNRALHCPNEDP
ncbi:hypothetical protein GH733_016223 [Mirounga leonina]|nr:hypothetical protein GH733_016223 [Mirounga leonina]